MVDQKPPTVGSVAEPDDISAAASSSPNASRFYAGLFNSNSAQSVGLGMGFSNAFGNVAGVSSLGRAQGVTTIFGSPLDDDDDGERREGKLSLSELATLTSSGGGSFFSGLVDFLSALLDTDKTTIEGDLRTSRFDRKDLIDHMNTVVAEISNETSNPETAQEYLGHCRTEYRLGQQIRLHPRFISLSSLRQAALFDYTSTPPEADTEINLQDKPVEALAFSARAINNTDIMTSTLNGFDHVVYQDENNEKFVVIDGERITELENIKGSVPVIIPAHFTQLNAMINLGVATTYERALQLAAANGDVSNQDDINQAVSALELRELVSQRNKIAAQRSALETAIGNEITPEQRQQLNDLWVAEFELDTHIEKKENERLIVQHASDVIGQETFKSRMSMDVQMTEDGLRYMSRDSLERIIDECVAQQDLNPAVLAGVKETIVSKLAESGIRIDQAPALQEQASTMSQRETGSAADHVVGREHSNLQGAFAAPSVTDPSATSTNPAVEGPELDTRATLNENFKTAPEDPATPAVEKPGNDPELNNDGNQ